VVIVTDWLCIGSCKSIYHIFMTMTLEIVKTNICPKYYGSNTLLCELTETTFHRKTYHSTLTNYPHSKSTSLCSDFLILHAKQRNIFFLIFFVWSQLGLEPTIYCTQSSTQTIARLIWLFSFVKNLLKDISSHIDIKCCTIFCLSYSNAKIAFT
jgi:hypothetical protein